jgi:hypothetical protein
MAEIYRERVDGLQQVLAFGAEQDQAQVSARKSAWNWTWTASN